MLSFTIREVVCVAAIVAAIAGVGCRRRTKQRIEQVRQGVEDVDKHAKEIEKASQETSR